MTMKYLLAIDLFLVATLAMGTEVTVRDYEPPMIDYPAKVYSMTDAEFHRWATKANRKAEKNVVPATYPKWIYDAHYRSYISQTWGRWGGLRGGSGMVETRTLNPDYTPPTPLHTINPFCPPTRPQ
jgi:hypothetical protein